MTPEEAAALFFPDCRWTLRPLGQGNINLTCLLELANGRKLVLQHLNPAVFPDPQAIQENLRLVSAHLQRRARPGPLDLRILRPAAARGKSALADPEGGLWRLLTYIGPSRTLATIHTTAQAVSLGAVLGWFHQAMADFDASQLVDPLPGFHDTGRYLGDLEARLQTLPSLPAQEARCRDQIRSFAHLVTAFAEQSSGLSRQVIHSDPKVANFLFDATGRQAISLIDLDTVRFGVLIHDIADCLRSACNPAGEEPEDPEKVPMREDLFLAVLQGYGSQAAGLLRPEDRRMILTATRLICLELAIRFLSDHLAGDRYFRVDYPGQNLVRARVQLALLHALTRQEARLQQLLAEKLLASLT